MSKATDKEQQRRSKAELRRELEQETQRFLHDGGRVTEVPAGISAWAPGEKPPPGQPLFTQPRSERTPLHEVVATLEARRVTRRNRGAVQRTRKPTPRKKVIYDDFGEPLRTVWSDD